MKKICILVLSLAMLCFVFSSTTLAANFSGPYYAFNQYISIPDVETFALEMCRKQYELAYMKERGLGSFANRSDQDIQLQSTVYLAFPSSENILSGTSQPFIVSGFDFIPQVFESRNFYNNRQIKMNVYLDANLIQEKYAKMDFFRDHVEEAKKYSSVSEQVKYVNNFLCDYLSYDNSVLRSVEDIIRDRKSECDGYSYLASVFLNLLGIPNYSLATETHTWNCVYVDGAWKHLDVTWNDTSYDRNQFFLIDEIDKFDSHNWRECYTEENIKFMQSFALLVTEDYKSCVKADVYAELDQFFLNEEAIDNYRSFSSKYYGRKWGLIPDNILSMDNLDAFITRKDFCGILVQTIEKIFDKPIEKILEEKQVSEQQISFLDTEDPSVIALAKLGIIAGTGGGYFDPNGWVNRAQAAIFVGRVAEKVLNVNMDAQKIDFSVSNFIDKDTIVNSWYKDGISWAMIYGVVVGGANNCYNPNEYRTYKESIDIANKMYVIFK